MIRWNKSAGYPLAGLSLAALLAFQTKPTQTKPTQARPTQAKTAQTTTAPYNRLKSGIEYRIYKRVSGRYTRQPAVVPATAATAYAKRIGQVMALHVEYRTAKDSVLFQSRKQQMGFPARVQLQALKSRGGIEEALSLLQPGDSAAFRFNADSLSIKSSGQPAPPQIKRHGNTMRVLVKVVAIQSEADAMAAQQQAMQQLEAKAQQQAEKQKTIDDQLIQDYLQQNHLQAQKTAAGTYYVITQPGAGPQPQPGQTVSVRYQGALLIGKVFDSSEKHGGTPFDFVLGRGQVIAGWDEGIAQLPKGSKAILLIPSGQAYGGRGAGADIPPYAVLRFDVELTDIK
ncbi:hypothetical protein B0919_08845 [Hymenobacter sp. CRA2]|nr:hypothetical protein B0919_08845 [Hymenobacter sp. CRA2]